MPTTKITTILEGVPRFVRQLQLADVATRERTIAAVKRGTQRVAAAARSRAPVKSGEMASTIRDEYSKDGLVGFVKVGFGKLPRRSRASTIAKQQKLAKKRRARGTRAGKGSYAPVVERGDPRRHHRPHPFVMPAFNAEKSGIVDEIAKATHEGAKAGGLE